MNQKQLSEFYHEIKEFLTPQQVVKITNIFGQFSAMMSFIKRADKIITNCPHGYCISTKEHILVDIDKLKKEIEMI